MLHTLHIRNFAIIDDLKIVFGPRLNIITGETGAGKSILLGALSLILGNRADSAALKNKAEKCVIEAVFNQEEQEGIKKFLIENDIDNNEEIIVRREIAAGGAKSRSFINDTPVSLALLKELASYLVDLHQQFDTLDLTGKDFQLQLIDALAGSKDLLVDLNRQYAALKILEGEIVMLKDAQLAGQKELDYNQFLFNEIEEAGFKEDEIESLDEELKLLSNAETIKSQLNAVYFELKESEQPIASQLKVLQQKMTGVSLYIQGAEDLTKRLESLVIEANDLAEEVEQLANKVHYDEERINIVNDRIALAHKLLKKHGVQTTIDLLEIKDSLNTKLVGLADVSEKIVALQNQQKISLENANALAEKLHQQRIAQIAPFVKNVNGLLGKIGMPNAKIDVSVKEKNISADGKDDITILFDANNSNNFEPLAKVASGGELSRLMLSVKSLVAEKLALPTLVFDEIDTGISGEAAKQVGQIMKGLANQHQVIVVSHQPQVAAKADTHLYVYKSADNGAVSTSIKELSTNERINAIAQMIGGENPSHKALENAKEMVGSQ